MDVTSGFPQAAPIKPMINLGACLDIPSGSYYRGKYGDSILNAGLGALTGVVGIGNSFKSTLMHFMLASAWIKVGLMRSGARTYDTEINIQEWHLQIFIDQVAKYYNLPTERVFELARWVITDKATYDEEAKKFVTGDVWFDQYRDYVNNIKIKGRDKLLLESPFLDRDGSFMKVTLPTFTEMDSFSEFVTSDVIKMQEDNSLGDAKGNTISMRQGIQKNRVLMEVPFLSNAGSDYMLLTAHIGAEFTLDPYNPPPQKLAFLRGVKIKGAPEKFTFSMNMCWYNYHVKVMKHDDTKAPLYPRNKNDDLRGDTDLQLVSTIVLRNKNGPTGMAVGIVVSQEQGVLPGLTEFHYIKECKFGFSGNNINYSLDLLPDVALSRTVVRSKIDNNPLLRRALRITSEMCQMYELWHSLEDCIVMTPKELYDRLKAKGFDWDILLQTRDYWMFNDYDQPIPRLTTMDLLNMTRDTSDPAFYFPYWMNPDMSIKPQYQSGFANLKKDS